MDRLYNSLPLIAALVMGAALVAASGWQGYELWQQWQSPADTEARSGQAAQTDSSPSLEVSLEELKLFGTPGEEPVEDEVVDTEDLPETNLQLTLRGVMAGREDKLTSALVEGSDGDTEMYRLGEELPGEARLHQIHQRRIIIERNGELENLHFPESETDGQMAVRGNDNGSAETTEEPDVDPDTDGDAGEGQDDAVRERLDELRERLGD